jgi:hypothetical protein
MEEHSLLPGLPADLIRSAYLGAPGNEIESGKFGSPESSAALVANTFGLFLEDPAALPALPSTPDCSWPAESMALEAIVRFPEKAHRGRQDAGPFVFRLIEELAGSRSHDRMRNWPPIEGAVAPCRSHQESMTMKFLW